LSIKMLKHTEIYDYKFSVQAVTPSDWNDKR
jgi:hypothetical protein